MKKRAEESDEEYTERQHEYILNFRADSIVEDLERFRKTIVGDRKWSILGQSYGGFCCFTYLSLHKDSLKQVLITGGIPPIGFHADDVYKATYQRCKERNIHYYDKYPTDIKKVRGILQFLNENTINLPNSGKLTVERFQQLGIILGSQGGTDRLHEIVSKFDHDLNVWKAPTYSILHDIQNESTFDTNVIYALFQEAIYCDGTMKEIKTNWSADRIRYLPGNENFVFEKSLDQLDPVFFTGEMVFRSMYDDYSELSRFKPLAEALHANTNWSVLYNIDVLKYIDWNDVQIVAATYYYDQYVDFNTSMAVKDRLFPRNANLRQYITSEFFHGGLRTNPDKVLNSLFDLLQEEVD